MQAAQSLFRLPWGQGLQSAQSPFTLPWGHGLQSAHFCFTLPWGQEVQVAQEYFTLPLGQALQTAQLRFSLPWGQGLQSAQLPFRFPCGQGLHSAQRVLSFPCGHGLHAAHSSFRLPCTHRFRILLIVHARPSPRAAMCGRAREERDVVFKVLGRAKVVAFAKIWFLAKRQNPSWSIALLSPATQGRAAPGKRRDVFVLENKLEKKRAGDVQRGSSMC